MYKNLLPGELDSLDQNNRKFKPSDTIDDICDQVVSDLNFLKYTNISIHNSIPNNLGPDETLICFRTSRVDNNGNNDFYFMRYDQRSNSWYHKCGSGSVILKYNYVPSNSMNWTNETFNKGGYYSPTITYQDNIKFIKYTRNKKDYDNTFSNESINISLKRQQQYLLEINTKSKIHININISSDKKTKLFCLDAKQQRCSVFESGIIFLENTTNTVALPTTIGKYYIETHFNNDLDQGNLILNLSAGSHDYSNKYIWVNNRKHKAFCECGKNRMEGHVITIQNYEKTNRCILCGGTAEVGFIDGNKIDKSRVLFKSSNGSYAIDDGLFILRSLDINDYLNNTLKFYRAQNNEGDYYEL